MIITLGIPSSPTVTVTAGDGSVNLTVRTANAGVPPDNRSLKFNIKVSNENNEVVHDKNYSFPEYVSNTNITITVTDLAPGNYTIIVTAINEYGSSSSELVLFTGENNDEDIIFISSINYVNFNITIYLFFIFKFHSFHVSHSHSHREQ